jgi:hypothetical protein
MTVREWQTKANIISDVKSVTMFMVWKSFTHLILVFIPHPPSLST